MLTNAVLCQEFNSDGVLVDEIILVQFFVRQFGVGPAFRAEKNGFVYVLDVTRFGAGNTGDYTVFKGIAGNTSAANQQPIPFVRTNISTLTPVTNLSYISQPAGIGTMKILSNPQVNFVNNVPNEVAVVIKLTATRTASGFVAGQVIFSPPLPCPVRTDNAIGWKSATNTTTVGYDRRIEQHTISGNCFFANQPGITFTVRKDIIVPYHQPQGEYKLLQARNSTLFNIEATVT